MLRGNCPLSHTGFHGRYLRATHSNLGRMNLQRHCSTALSKTDNVRKPNIHSLALRTQEHCSTALPRRMRMRWTSGENSSYVTQLFEENDSLTISDNHTIRYDDQISQRIAESQDGRSRDQSMSHPSKQKPKHQAMLNIPAWPKPMPSAHALETEPLFTNFQCLQRKNDAPACHVQMGV